MRSFATSRPAASFGRTFRILKEPLEMAGSGLTSTPHTDFEVGLTRDLTAFGVLEADAEDYVQGVRRGGVMVFATGSGDKAQAATEIMNRHGAVEVGKISASRPELPRETLIKSREKPQQVSPPRRITRTSLINSFSRRLDSLRG